MSAARRGRPAAAALGLAVLALAGAAAAAPGGLDPRFDIDGRQAFGYGGDDRATDVALLPGGRVVTAGWTTVNGDIAVTRLTSRGAPDGSFGRGGTADIDLGGDDRANAVAPAPGGAVVVAGRTPGPGGEGDMAVLRLRAGGSPDPGFGRRGSVVLGSARGDAAYDVAVDRAGRTLVAGEGGPGADIVVARLTRRGGLDRGFGRRGRATVDLGGIDLGTALALGRDGRIVVAGATTEGDGDMAVARLRPDGRPDAGFGVRGRRRVDAGGADVAHAVAIDRRGRIVLAGTTSAGGGDLVVARLRPGGALDRGFGPRGIRRVDLGGADEGFDMAIDGVGRIVVAGRGGPRRAMAVVRLQPDGALDRRFGGGGRVEVDFPGRQDTALGVAVARGRIVVAGATDSQVAVARLRG